MSRIKNIKKNLVFAMLNKIALPILAFVSRTVFISTLGVEYLGVNGLFADLLTILSLADLGISSAIVYSFYEPLANNNKSRIAELVAFYKKVYTRIAITVLFIGLGMFIFLDTLINLNISVSGARYYFLFFLIDIVLSYCFVYKITLLEADQKNFIISKYNLIISVTKVSFQCFVLIVYKSFAMYLLTQVLFTLLSNIILSKVVDKMYFPQGLKFSRARISDEKLLVDNIKSMFVYKLSSVLINASDNIIISRLIGIAMVGYYSNYILLVRTITAIIGAFFNSATSSIGNIIITETEERRFEVFNIIFSFTLILASISSINLVLNLNNFILLWLGGDYMLSKITVYAVVSNFYLTLILQPLWTFREASGLYIKTKYAILIAAMINIVLSIVLGYKYGLPGILFATAISRLFTYFWYEPIILFKETFGKSPISYFKDIFVNSIFTIVLLSTLLLLDNKFFTNDVRLIVIKSILYLAISCIATFLFYLNDYRIKTSLLAFRRSYTPKKTK